MERRKLSLNPVPAGSPAVVRKAEASTQAFLPLLLRFLPLPSGRGKFCHPLPGKQGERVDLQLSRAGFSKIWEGKWRMKRRRGSGENELFGIWPGDMSAAQENGKSGGDKRAAHQYSIAAAPAPPP